MPTTRLNGDSTSATSLRLVCVLLLLAVICVPLSGCGSKSASESNESPSSVEGMTAEHYLQTIFSRYRNAQSYRDNGSVRFGFQVEGRSQNEVAPLSVWFDRNLLYVEAYDVRLRSDSHFLTAWIKDPTTADFDSQVVRVASPNGRPEIDSFFADTVLNERIAAGLAGPPPQLEWLFAAKPMKLLFGGDHQIAFTSNASIDDRDCVRIQVRDGGDLYRFWIDRRAGVIRRVDLPSILVPMQWLSKASPGTDESVRLTLELEGATFETPRDQPKQASLPEPPKIVGHFVPLPPNPPSKLLGTNPSAFSIRDQAGQLTLSQRGGDRDVTILLVAGKSTDGESTHTLTRWVGIMPADIRQRVRTALVTNEKGFRKLPREYPLPVFIDKDRVIESAFQVQPNDLIILDRNGQIVWHHHGITPESLPRLGLIVGDIINGVNVPQRLQDQYQGDLMTYQSVLASEVAKHSQTQR